MQGFVYIWRDKKRKMYYIGSHLGSETDGYLCSSNRMRDAYRRRPQDFKRKIIKRMVGRNELLIEEHRLLAMIPDNELGVKYYNLRKHRFGHWSTDYERTQRVADKLRGQKRTPEQCALIAQRTREAMARPQVKAKTIIANNNISPERLEKMRIAKLGTKDSDETKRKKAEGTRNREFQLSEWIKVHGHSDETRRKISMNNARRKR